MRWRVEKWEAAQILQACLAERWREHCSLRVAELQPREHLPLVARPAVLLLLSSTLDTSTRTVGFFEVVGLEGYTTQKLEDSTGFSGCKGEWRGRNLGCSVN